MKRRRYSSFLWGSLFSLLIVVALVLLPAASAPAQNDLCLTNNIGGLAGLPTIDGIVEGYTGPGGVQYDPGWNRAVRVNLSANLGVSRSAVFQMGRSSTDVYISFVVDTPVPGGDNHIVLVLSTDGNTAHDWRIHVQPFDSSTAGAGFEGSNEPPHAVTYWRNSTTWNNAGATATVASPGFWLKDNIRFSKAGSRWAIEIKIPRETNSANAGLDDKIYFPATGEFDFYANILSTSFLSGVFYQDPWPPGNIITAGAASSDLTRNTPNDTQWGTVSFNDRSVCKGVSLASSNVGVYDPTNPGVIINEILRYEPSGSFPETTIAQCQALTDNHNWPGTKGPLNTFVARPFNEMTSIDAKVSATFKVANWGIPGVSQWRDIGEIAGGLSLTPSTVANNPTPEATIIPSGYGNLTSTWELSYKQSCMFSKVPHQCIQVELDSSDGGDTIFLNKSVQRNMDFVQASAFSRDAEISAIGYGNPPAGRTAHEFLLSVNTKVQRYERDGGYYVPVGFKMPLITWQGKPASDTTRKKGERVVPDWSRISWDKIPIPFPYFDIKISEAMTWITRGYRKTGQYLVINGQEYEYAEYVGGFGYVVAHEGSVAKWTEKLVGENGELKPTKQKGLYSIEIPPGEVRRVATKVKAVEPTGIRKCFDWLR